jgi:AcrR family transcriptional regulator
MKQTSAQGEIIAPARSGVRTRKKEQRSSKVATPGPRDERGVLAQRILAEARASFAENGWAGTTARAVARAADVDPALVYHYFGSKEGLLDAATTIPERFANRVAAAWQVPEDELGEQLARRMLGSWEDEELGPILRAILQIAAHEPNTRKRLRTIIEQSLMGPSRIGLTDRERAKRSSLIASQLLGLAFMRYVWKIEPLASLKEERLVAAIAPNIQRYVDGDIEPVKAPRRNR